MRRDVHIYIESLLDLLYDHLWICLFPNQWESYVGSMGLTLINLVARTVAQQAKTWLLATHTLIQYLATVLYASSY